ncbi:MAG: TlpA family protein disulfide reductase [Acidobacteria bacterium]|nr:TlpA family protein disulfide reductase [Acidobacteriota bacterium]
MNSSRLFVELRPLTLFSFLIISTAVSLSLIACQPKTVYPVGTWRGFVKNPSGEEVAFTLEIKREDSQLVGSLINGDDRTTSTSGSFDGKTLKLRYDFYDGELTAAVDGDQMRGTFDRQWGKKILKRELSASRGDANVTSLNSGSVGAEINGEWVLRVGEAPKQSFWRAAFKQQGREVRGTIMPMSGDWGEFTGAFENNQLTLNHFDGINSRIYKARLTPEGKLDGYVDLGLFSPKRNVVAERIDVKNKEIVATLPDPNNYTRMANRAEPLRFSFPDLDGKVVSSSDDRFKNKVVVVSITGSWCPNCHEEAPVLQEFYDRYRAQGLEVVALAFEYTGDASRDLKQLKIFNKRHNITYPTLLAGSTEEGEIGRKLPQLVNFGAYPTTIFIGRDGLVDRIHAGFEGKATGERFTKLKAEYEELIKDLLAGREL